MNFTHSFGILLRFLSFLAVVGIILLATSIFAYSFYEIYNVIRTIFVDHGDETKVILKALKSIDMVLLGVVFFIMGVGLFELFVASIDNLPEWLIIKDIDQLKTMLVKVIIVVMAVSFAGRIISWDGESDIMGYGLGLGAVIFAMAYFLRVKIDKHNSEK